MSDLGTHRVYTTNFQGIPAGITLDDPQINSAVKKRAQHSAAGALADKMTPSEQEGPLEVFHKWLLGLTIPGVLGKVLRENVLSEKNFKATSFNTALNKIDGGFALDLISL